jgi:small-conductance mechanosensitive channel
MGVLKVVLEELLGYIGGYRYVLEAAAILLGSLLIAILASRYFRSRALARLSVEIVNPVSRLIFISILFIGFVLALNRVGLDIGSILVAGGLLAIAVGFAAQTTVSSLLSGTLIYIDRPFKVGEAVSIGANMGVVEDISVFSTRLRAFDGRLIRIPNEDVFKSTIVNLTATKARRLEYQIPLQHDVDLKKTVEVVKRVLDSHPLVLAEPQPMIFVAQATVEAVTLNIWAWVPQQRFFQVWTELLASIRDELAKEGIQLALPQRVIRVRTE